APARALVIAPPPGPLRVVNADCVVAGTVTSIEKDDVEVEVAPGAKQKITYRIAVVTIADGIKGAKDQKTVRVAFIPPNQDPAKPPKLPIRPGGRGPVLKLGQEGLFYLTKHPKESFYLAPIFYDVISRDSKDYAEHLAAAKKGVKLL